MKEEITTKKECCGHKKTTIELADAKRVAKEAKNKRMFSTFAGFPKKKCGYGPSLDTPSTGLTSGDDSTVSSKADDSESGEALSVDDSPVVDYLETALVTLNSRMVIANKPFSVYILVCFVLGYIYLMYLCYLCDCYGAYYLSFLPSTLGLYVGVQQYFNTGEFGMNSVLVGLIYSAGAICFTPQHYVSICFCVSCCIAMHGYFNKGCQCVCCTTIGSCSQQRLANFSASEVGIQNVTFDDSRTFIDDRLFYWLSRSRVSSRYDGLIYTNLASKLISLNRSVAKNGRINDSRVQVMFGQVDSILVEHKCNMLLVDDEVLSNTIVYAVSRIELAMSRSLAHLLAPASNYAEVSIQ